MCTIFPVCYRLSAFLQVFHEILLVLQCCGSGSAKVFPCADTAFYLNKSQFIFSFRHSQFAV